MVESAKGKDIYFSKAEEYLILGDKKIKGFFHISKDLYLFNNYNIYI